MKVYIGNYKSWIGPYQIADMLKKVKVSDDTCHKIGTWISDTWVMSFCTWINKKRKRTVKIRIDQYDTWSADSTLTYIILPLLKQLRSSNHGSVLVDDCDVPDNIKSISAPTFDATWQTDDNVHARWDYVLNEIIWSFEQIHPDHDWEDQFYQPLEKIVEADIIDKELDKILSVRYKFDLEGMTAHSDKINNGLRLFGKYYRGMWT